MINQGSENTKRRGNYGIRKADITLIAACLLAAALLAVFFVIHREAGNSARIMYDGIELQKIDLYSAQTDSAPDAGTGCYLITCRDDIVNVEYFRYKPEPKLPEGTGYNLVSITDGVVVMEAADCRDQICVQHKPISSKGESIICLPHRLVVEIVGGENEAADFQDGNFKEMPDEQLDGVVR